MPEQQLKPMRWPRPVPVLWWVGDYADIRERIRRDGRLDTIDDVWVPWSEDSYDAFCRRHGTYCFGEDWRELVDRDRRVDARSRERLAEQARRAQEEWEERRRERQLAKQAQADELWRGAEGDIAKAKAFWSEVDAAYAEQGYHLVVLRKALQLYDTAFEAGRPYWVPTAVMFGIKGHGGL